MTKKNSEPKVDRRKFMAGVAAAGAAGAVSAADKAKAAAPAATPAPSAVRPSLAEQAAESKGTPQIWANPAGKPGSDFMVDVIKSLDIDYIVTNPASSCRGIHESLNNYGMNVKPELLTVMHEESGTAMGHGYFKVTGKPLAGLYHGTVGLQHAAMAIYNAWCDRAPVIVLIGNHLDASERPPGVPTAHSAIDPISVVRDFTKWDDQPWSLQHFAESMVRAYKICMTPPTEPVARRARRDRSDHTPSFGRRGAKLVVDTAGRMAARLSAGAVLALLVLLLPVVAHSSGPSLTAPDSSQQWEWDLPPGFPIPLLKSTKNSDVVCSRHARFAPRTLTDWPALGRIFASPLTCSPLISATPSPLFLIGPRTSHRRMNPSASIPVSRTCLPGSLKPVTLATYLFGSFLNLARQFSQQKPTACSR